jgi:hypothetical protein
MPLWLTACCLREPKLSPPLIQAPSTGFLEGGLPIVSPLWTLSLQTFGLQYVQEFTRQAAELTLTTQFPTNTWWAPYLAQPGDQNAAGPFPYQSSLDGSGVKFGVSTERRFDGTSVQQPVRIDWLTGFSEHQGSFDGHKATAFDEQTVTVQYFQGDARMTAYLVPGSPYMTFDYDGATPLLEPQNASVKSFNGKPVSEGSTGELQSTDV